MNYWTPYRLFTVAAWTRWPFLFLGNALFLWEVHEELHYLTNPSTHICERIIHRRQFITFCSFFDSEACKDLIKACNKYVFPSGVTHTYSIFQLKSGEDLTIQYYSYLPIHGFESAESPFCSIHESSRFPRGAEFISLLFQRSQFRHLV